jgi:hypothetical protein
MAKTNRARLEILDPGYLGRNRSEKDTITMSYSVTGTVKHISEVQHVGENQYPKRVVWIEHGDRYPQVSSFEAFGEKSVTATDGLEVGQVATVHFDLRGREYENKRTGAPAVFNSLSLWRVETGSDAGGSGGAGFPDDDVPF